MRYRSSSKAIVRQAGGMEGLAAVGEPVLANDLPLPDSGEDRVVVLNFWAAHPSAQLKSVMQQDFVGPDRDAFDIASAPGAAQPLDGVVDGEVEVPGSLSTAHTTLRPVVDSHDLEVLMMEREP